MLPTDPEIEKLLSRLMALQAEADRVVDYTSRILSDADRLLARSRMILAVRAVVGQKADEPEMKRAGV